VRDGAVISLGSQSLARPWSSRGQPYMLLGTPISVDLEPRASCRTPRRPTNHNRTLAPQQSSTARVAASTASSIAPKEDHADELTQRHEEAQ